MTTGMIRFLALAALAALGLGGHAQAQTFPTKPIRLAVPFAPGGGPDNLMRIIVPEVSASLGQQINIDNKPGGGSVGGTDIVAKAPADGYTILASDSAFVTNPGLMKNLPYQTLRDFTGVTMMARAPVILVVHPSVPARTIGELVALAKAKPGTLNYASGGNGSSTHLAGELLKQVAGIDIVHVPYKGGGAGVLDLISGQIEMCLLGTSTTAPRAKSGQLRAIAVTSGARSPLMPEVPTMAEAGVNDFVLGPLFLLLAPAGTPADIVARLARESVAVAQMPEFRNRLVEIGSEPVEPLTGEAFSRFVLAEAQRWREMAAIAGLKDE